MSLQVPAVAAGPPTTKAACKNGGWKTFTNPSFKNQGQCVAYVNHHSSHGKSHTAHKTHKLAKKGEQHAAETHSAQRTRRSTGSRARPPLERRLGRRSRARLIVPA